ncbi:MAG TPA: hypothetical protein VK646_09740 [Actinomycetota bacterium]|nr:hypothetical protein [Actinomycetota bacterium]
MPRDEIWAQTVDDAGNPIPRSRRSTSLKEARRYAERRRRETEARFRKAPFPLYGLPTPWVGPRLLGGADTMSRGGGRARTTALSLVHGTNAADGDPWLVVESSPEPSVGGGWFQIVARMAWDGSIAHDADAALTYLRETNDPILPEGAIPSIEHATWTFDVDGLATTFDAYRAGEEWSARARIGELWVTVDGWSFDTREVALARILDLDPYIDGTRRRYAGTG